VAIVSRMMPRQAEFQVTPGRRNQTEGRGKLSSENRPRLVGRGPI
jgi:hypothetical protein